jgi:glycosyltransferase involved in cell wall biosynthesis
MRIVQFVPGASVGGPSAGADAGAVAAAVAQSRELARRGHDVVLLAGGDGVADPHEADLHVAGARVALERVPPSAARGARSRWIRSWLAEHAPGIDVLHVHSVGHALDREVTRAARRLGIRHVLEVHGAGTPGIDRAMSSRAVRGAACVLVSTGDEERAILARFGDARVARLPDGASIGRSVDALLDRYAGPALAAASRPSVVWMTNLAPPYRVPVWNALARDVDLEVWLLESDERLRSDDNNRGDDWTAGDRDAPYTTRFLPNRVVRRGEARHYVTGWIPRSALRGRDAILIGGWDSPAYWVASWSAKLAGVRRVGFYESHRLSQQHQGGAIARVRRAFFAGMDEIVVPGIAAWEALVAEGIDPARIRVGFNAVDVAAIHASTRAARRAAGAPAGPVGSRLLCVGQLIPRKNVAGLIEALAAPELAACTLTVVGAGPERESLELSVGELGLGSRVAFAGYVPATDLPGLFARHDVLVHPALQEVWGLTVNEALAAGLTVVVGEHAGVTASVRGMRGVVTTEVTAEGLRRGILAAVPAAPIETPEILTRTPEDFAATFRGAMLAERPGPLPAVPHRVDRSEETIA